MAKKKFEIIKGHEDGEIKPKEPKKKDGK